MEYYGVIYLITFPNNKMYVGQTKNFSKRQREHKNIAYNEKDDSYYYPVYCAIRYYGWDSLKWEIIDYGKDKADLSEKEIYWIEKKRTNVYFEDCNGYNVTLGGETGIPPHKFITQKSVQEILELFKETGSITEVSKIKKSCYNLIYSIILGKTRQKLSGITDDTFYKKYNKFGTKYTQEQIKEIFEMHDQGFENKEIEKELGISVRYIQDVLGGRVRSKMTGIKPVSREERNYFNPVNSILTKEQVLDMVKMSREGKTPREIADKYNKNINRIYEILNGVTWSKITGIERKDKLKIAENGEKYRKFTKEDVLSIVQEFKEGKDKKELAQKYNTSVNYIKSILNGRKWNNVTHIKDN